MDMASRRRIIKRDKNCDRCNLCQTAEYICLLGKGPIPCDVMMIGEAPGQREEDDGEPFVGKAGHLLDDIFEDLGIERKDIYMTNAVHCRPPDNRTPRKKEINECKYWLEKEIKAVKPKFILTFGNVPLEALHGVKGIKKLRGIPIERDGIIYFPMYHPSYALHDPRQLSVVKGDIKTFKGIVDRGGPLEECGVNYKIVTKKNLEKALEDIKNTKVISIDTETSGLNPFEPGSWVTSLGIGTSKTQWCFPLNHYKSKIYANFKSQKRLIKKIDKVIDDKKIIVMQNGKFDTLQIAVHFGVWWYCTFDTMLAHYNCDENSRHGLDYLAQKYYDANNYDIPLEEKWGIVGTLKRHCKYLALDLYYTRKLFFTLKKELKRDKLTYRLFTELTMPIATMYTDIEYHGVYVNPKELGLAHKYWTKKANGVKRKLDKLFPSDSTYKDKRTDKIEIGINWGSPQQLGEILFGKLKLKVLDKTAGGKAATTKSVLLRLADKHKIPRLIIDYRKALKNLNTFIEPWQRRSINNRFHPTCKIHGTVTGRPSMEEPNLQQTPRDPRLRKIIRAPKGRILIDADESQVEMRLAADASQDPELLLIYQTGGDVHTLTVQRTFGIMKPTSEERKKGKAINFGYLFGMWWVRFQTYARDNFEVIMSDKESKESREEFFRLYKGLVEWHRRQKRFAKQHGFVRNRIGRLRRLPDAMNNDGSYECKEAQRQAINSPIQSLASDITLLAAVEVHNKMDRSRAHIVGTVHDSILVECDIDYVDELCTMIKQAMEMPQKLKDWNIRFSIPLEAEIELGPWGDHDNNKKWKMVVD